MAVHYRRRSLGSFASGVSTAEQPVDSNGPVNAEELGRSQLSSGNKLVVRFQALEGKEGREGEKVDGSAKVGSNKWEIRRPVVNASSEIASERKC